VPFGQEPESDKIARLERRNKTLQHILDIAVPLERRDINGEKVTRRNKPCGK
jgi:hypothetical protein